jgi:hypothetical protein
VTKAESRTDDDDVPFPRPIALALDEVRVVKKPCGTCGTPAPYSDKCDNCWEVERRLFSYLREGGSKAKAFVTEELANAGKSTPCAKRDPVIIGDIVDLENWIAEENPHDVMSLELDHDGEPLPVAKVIARLIGAAGHPAYGEDWADWLAEDGRLIALEATKRYGL